MPRDSKLYLEDIRQAIDKIEVYTREVSFNDLQQNSMLLDAVLHNLEIIGKAAKHLPEKLKTNHPEIE